MSSDAEGFMKERFFGLIHVVDTAALTLRPRLGVLKGMERNGMYLSKGKEWNGMKLSNLDWMF